MSKLQGESLRIIMIIIGGWSLFSCADVLAKHLIQFYTASYIIALGGMLNLILVGLWIFFKYGLKGFSSNRKKWLILRSFFTGFISFGAVNAFHHLPIADVYGITFLAPFLTVVMAALFLKERVDIFRWLAVLAGFAGVIILAQPQYEDTNIGLFYAALAAFCIAGGTVVIRKIGQEVPSSLMIFYSFMGMLAVNTPILLSHEIPPLAIEHAPLLLANALFALCGIVMTVYGFSHANTTSSVAPFLYVQVIWGVLFGIYFFGDYPTTTGIIGLGIIIAAGLSMIYREQKLYKRTSSISDMQI